MTGNRAPAACKNRLAHGARFPRWTAALLALVVALSFTPSIATGATGVTHAFTITNASASPQTPMEAFDAVSMAAVDLTGDGVKEILAHNDNNRFYVFDGANGALLAEHHTTHPPGWGSRVLAGPAVGDLTGDGKPNIVLTNSAGWVTALNVHVTGGTPKLTLSVLWERHMDPHKEDPNYKDNMAYGTWRGNPAIDGPVFLADVTGDGRDHVFVQLDDMPGLYRITPDGNVDWWAHIADGNSGPLVGDLTGNGKLEVVYASDGGRLHIYNAHTMASRCVFHAQGHGAWPGSISVSPTLADLTGDGRLEIVFGVRNVYPDQNDPDWMDKSNAMHFAVRHDCTVLWKRTWDWNSPHVHMHPIPVDITGNGRQDIIFQDWNTIGHKPGNFEVTGNPNLYAIEGHSGNLLWQRTTVTFWSNKNLALADITGNGQMELLVNEWRHNSDGIGLYALNGQFVDFIPGASGWLVKKGPLVADLNGNGRLDIVLPLHRSANFCEQAKDVGCREGALRVYHTTSTAKPHYANNHMLRVEDAPTSGPGGEDIRFTNPRGNEWWVETNVEGAPIVSVDARVGTGSWRALDATSWGSWAKSLHAPTGSTVQFRAQASDGKSAQSGCYEWPQAHPTTCPSGSDEPAPSPPGFDATFRNPRGNQWWVETNVDSSSTISSVHARLDEGSWQALTATDWGSWARSMNAPQGTIVQFRATSTGGATALSDCYVWTAATATACGAEQPGVRFDRVRGNTWWVETNVVSDASITAVHARVNGGSWQALAATDWGSWARSMNAPTGSTVEFRATTTSGTVISEPYPWPP